VIFSLGLCHVADLAGLGLQRLSFNVIAPLVTFILCQACPSWPSHFWICTLGPVRLLELIDWGVVCLQAYMDTPQALATDKPPDLQFA